MPTDEFSDRAVIITGGGGGVGQTVTRRWLEAGAHVFVADHSDTTLTRLRDSLPANSQARLGTFAGDLTTQDGAEGMVAAAAKVFGKSPDTLIHLIGGVAMGALDAPESGTLWQKMLAMNATSAFQCYRALLPGLKTRGGGWIVGLGARVAVAPAANMAAYSASKAALLALTLALSDEVRAQGIRVNLMLASTIDTSANRGAMGDAHGSDWVSPDDIADATFYLCSERARAVYGATLEVYSRS
jgi:NAD(P)-dependent dehydrogenase (short-subunit alcohol dehydrogenase family)